MGENNTNYITIMYSNTITAHMASKLNPRGLETIKSTASGSDTFQARRMHASAWAVAYSCAVLVYRIPEIPTYHVPVQWKQLNALRPLFLH